MSLGVYRPIIALLANPIAGIRRDGRFFLPILIGFAAGILGLSRLVDWFFRASPTPAIWLFIGLIAGSLPSLFREADRKGRSAGSFIALIGGLALGLSLFFLLRRNIGSAVTPNTFWWLLCGALWGLGIVVPGMSPSSVFIFLGLYQPMSAGIADMDFAILLPLLAGLVVSALGLSRVMRWLLERAASVTMYAVIGVMIAATVVIVPAGGGPGEANNALSAACCAAGLLIAIWMGMMNAKREASA